VGPSGSGQYLPLATQETTTFSGAATDIYRIGVAQFAQQLHPDLAGPTHLWGYYDLAARDHKYLGGVIVASETGLSC
jgi:hypothetical protein